MRLVLWAFEVGLCILPHLSHVLCLAAQLSMASGFGMTRSRAHSFEALHPKIFYNAARTIYWAVPS